MTTSTLHRDARAHEVAPAPAPAPVPVPAPARSRFNSSTPSHCGSHSPTAFAVLAGLLIACHAAPSAAQTACYVRAEAPAASAAAAPGSGQSHVGLRRKSDKLFELDIAVTGPNAAVCTVGGVARLSGDAGKEALAMVVRPDPLRSKGVRSGALCHVYVQLTATAVELRTTREACKAQSLCDGKVDLNGQRFDASSRLPDGVTAPCFERRVL